MADEERSETWFCDEYAVDAVSDGRTAIDFGDSGTDNVPGTLPDTVPESKRGNQPPRSSIATKRRIIFRRKSTSDSPEMAIGEDKSSDEKYVRALRRRTIGLSVLVVVLVAALVLSFVLPLRKNQCQNDSDCGDDGVCGLKEARSSAPRICCTRSFGANAIGERISAINVVLDDGSSAPVCSNRPAGVFCNDSYEICKSRVCTKDKTCLFDEGEDGQECSDSRNCRSGACGH